MWKVRRGLPRQRGPSIVGVISTRETFCPRRAASGVSSAGSRAPTVPARGRGETDVRPTRSRLRRRLPGRLARGGTRANRDPSVTHYSPVAELWSSTGSLNGEGTCPPDEQALRPQAPDLLRGASSGPARSQTQRGLRHYTVSGTAQSPACASLRLCAPAREGPGARGAPRGRGRSLLMRTGRTATARDPPSAAPAPSPQRYRTSVPGSRSRSSTGAVRRNRSPARAPSRMVRRRLPHS